MTSLALDHVNIETAALARLRAFYTEVLGLREGPRPPSSSVGVWLYTVAPEARPVVHLVEATAGRGLSHFAFSGRRWPALLARLTRAGVPFRVRERVSVGGAQGPFVTRVNLSDPDGNEIHLDFPASTEDASTGEEGLTCGQELASAAEIPAQWAALMSHIAINLESHAVWVGTTTAAAAAEHDGMRAVAAAYRGMADAATLAAKVLVSMKDLPPAPHAPARFDRAAQMAWMRQKLSLQSELARMLLAHAAEADDALAAWESADASAEPAPR